MSTNNELLQQIAETYGKYTNNELLQIIANGSVTTTGCETYNISRKVGASLGLSYAVGMADSYDDSVALDAIPLKPFATGYTEISFRLVYESNNGGTITAQCQESTDGGSVWNSLGDAHTLTAGDLDGSNFAHAVTNPETKLYRILISVTNDTANDHCGGQVRFK